MRRTALLPLLLVPLLVSCSGAANDRAAKVPAPARAQAVSGPSVERTVIRTARIAVRVKDSRRAADAAVAVAGQRHGRVDSDERSEAGHGSATLVLRVPPAAVEDTLSDLARLGKETGRSVSDQDVTSQAVDVASRVATQRASVVRVRGLLARAQSLTDITRIEGELTRREADLESLQNRQDALTGQVELASVTVTLSGSGAGAAGHAGFADGLAGGWTALVGTARVLTLLAGALLPWSWLLVLLVVARVAWRRRRPAAA